MSKGQRFPLAIATLAAMDAHEVVRKHAQRVEIAGSIRRLRLDVGDIDLVVLEDDANPWQRGMISTALVGMGYEQTKDGEKIASFTHERRPSLDLYYATLTTWGITVLVRTGSAAHNIKIAQIGAHRAPARRLSVARGILDTNGRVVASATEDEIFAALGVPFVPPDRREAPELEHLIGAEEVT